MTIFQYLGDWIDVSQAPSYDTRNGNSYVRTSPRVSSGLLMATGYALAQEQRALIPEFDEIRWTFPGDYAAELRAAIHRADPEIAGKAIGAVGQ